MRLLKKHTAQLIRHTISGYYNDDGEWIAGAGDTPVTLKCCIQPAPQLSMRVTLPEGVREKDCRVIWTHSDLIGSTEVGAVEADIVIYKDLEYLIWDVGEWDGAHITATEALMIRKDRL